MTQLNELKLDSASVNLFYVFNKMSFEDPSLTYRKGSDVDANNLNQLFNKFNFVTRDPYLDLKQDEFNKRIDGICHYVRGVNNLGCLVIAFLSHGSEGRLQMHDRKVCIDDIIDQLSKVESLHRKPKILIFQACSGNQVARGLQSVTGDNDQIDVLTEHGTQQKVEEEGSDLISCLPLISEFVVCNSTAKGYVSFRDPEHGSRFIRKFCEVFKNYADGPLDEELDFLQLLTKVSAEVTKMNPETERRQMPSFTSTMTQNLYLPRRNNASEPTDQQ